MNLKEKKEWEEHTHPEGLTSKRFFKKQVIVFRI